MKKHFVAIEKEDGGFELHRLKQWLCQNPEYVPAGLDPSIHTTHQLRNGLRRKGWTLDESLDEVRLFRPSAAIQTDPMNLGTASNAPPSRIGERQWVRQLVPILESRLAEVDASLHVKDGYKLAYTREILTYEGAKAVQEDGMRYETDLLVFEQTGSLWTPRVVVEAKLRTVNSHDAITYSQKAMSHKQVHPYLRYGIFLGARRHHPLPGRLFRHGSHFDFMISWTQLQPTDVELDTLVTLLHEEVTASRLLQAIMFNTRSKKRAHYSVLHRPLKAW